MVEHAVERVAVRWANDIMWRMQRITLSLPAVRAAYVNGATIVEIATRFGTSSSTIQRRLTAAGTPLRRNGPRLLPQTVIIPSECAALGYLAGLFDGEGNLYWRRRTGRANSARLTIYSTTEAAIDWLHTFGGFVRWDTARVERHGWKPVGRWEVNRTRDVIALLDAMLPLLIIKREQATAVLADLRRYLDTDAVLRHV